MSDAFYRDPLAGIRSIIETKRARATDLGHAVTPLAWALATPSERVAITNARTRCHIEPTDFASATEVDRLSDQLLDGLERLVERVAAFGTPRAVELYEIPPPGSTSLWLSDDALFAHRDALEARVQQVFGTSLELWGAGYIARGTCGVLPIAFRTDAKASLHGAFASELRVGVVRTMYDGRDVPRVATALTELAPRHPELLSTRGLATISWTSTDHEQAHDPIPWEAIAAVAAIHLASR